jgi:hypothetical protein
MRAGNISGLESRSKDMNENRTASILQRLPIILAVTAASYGLAQPQPARNAGSAGNPQAAAQHAKAPVQQR